MDIEVARTFLAVVETGSFLEAAGRIHVTQSAVSMRIRTLERQLGQPLFERHRHGVTPTPAGQRFERHARAMVRIWTQARRDVSGSGEEGLAIGAPAGLWDGFLAAALARLRREMPGVALRGEALPPEEALRGLNEGRLDLAVLASPAGAGRVSVPLFEEELVLVTSDPEARLEALGSGLVVPPPGAEVVTETEDMAAAVRASRVVLGDGIPVLQYLRAVPASAYVPRRLLEGEAEWGLRPVASAPVTAEWIHAVLRPADREGVPGFAARILRETARAEG